MQRVTKEIRDAKETPFTTEVRTGQGERNTKKRMKITVDACKSVG